MTQNKKSLRSQSAIGQALARQVGTLEVLLAGYAVEIDYDRLELKRALRLAKAALAKQVECEAAFEKCIRRTQTATTLTGGDS